MAVRDVLDDALTQASNLSGKMGHDAHRKYIDWSNRTAFDLGRMVSAADIDRLVLTRQHWVLQQMVVESEAVQVRLLIQREMYERVEDLKAARDALDRQIAHWSETGHLVMPDTSFYIQNPEKLEKVDFQSHLNVPPFASVHILVPMVVVDELDGLKTSNNRHVGWRAVYTLAVLDDRLRDPTEPGTLHPRDSVEGYGAVSLELLFDRPGHTRLPIADDEIVDRAVALRGLAGKPVTILTCDTGQSSRARAAKLRAIKVPRQPGPEPEKPQGR